MKMSENDLLEICHIAVRKAVELGADEAEAYGVSAVEREASIEHNDVGVGIFHEESGIGIRILKNGALGFSSVNMLRKDDVNVAVDAAVRIAP